MSESGKKSGKGPEKPENDSEDVKDFAADYTTEDRLRQVEEIEREITSRPLIGLKEQSLDSLFEELKSNQEFLRKLPFLATKYSGLRRVRGDGNCFYRGFMFRLVETLLPTDISVRGRHGENYRFSKQFYDVKEKIDSSLEYLLEVNYEKHSVEFFVEMAQSFFNDKEPKNDEEFLRFPKTEVEMESFFADANNSMYLVWFCKLLSAAYIKHHWDERFQFFVEQDVYKSAQQFCEREVEPTECEANQIQITALCEYLGVPICVEYLDANPGKEETAEYFFGPEGQEVKITLLYRPGHYDVLYRRET